MSRMLKHAADHTAFDHLPRIRHPDLIVAGSRTDLQPLVVSEEMHDRIPGSEMLTVPGARTRRPSSTRADHAPAEKFLARSYGPARALRTASDCKKKIFFSALLVGCR